MARTAITTIDDKAITAFIATAEYRKELPCGRIRGFHLQKLAKDASWRFRYRGVDKKWRLINLGKASAIDRTEAAKIARKLESDVNNGRDPIFERDKRREQQRIEQQKAQSSTLRAFWDTHYKDTFKTKREGVAAVNRIFYHFHLVHDLFDRQLSTLNRADIHAWQRKCWDFTCPVKPYIGKGKTKKPNRKSLKHTTIQRAFNAIKTLLNMAVEEDVIAFNPLTHPKRVKLLPAPSDRVGASKMISEQSGRKAFETEELEAIRAGLNNYRALRREQRLRSTAKGKDNSARFCRYPDDHPDWFFPFFELAAYSGCAPGDLYTLTWQELKLKNRILSYTRNKTFDKAINAGKDPLKVNLPLNDRILKVMQVWHRQMGYPTSGLVFPSERLVAQGKPVDKCIMDKNAHQKHWNKVKELGGVPSEIVFYSLRHNFISQRVADGIPILEVAHLVGQRSTKMIEEHYGHLVPNAAEKAMADRLDSFGT